MKTLRSICCVSVLIASAVPTLYAHPIDAMPEDSMANRAADSTAYRAADSTIYKALDKKVADYFSAIAGEPLRTQCDEADFIIGTCTDSLVRNHVASTAYDFFRDSRIMGAENVAIHIFDNWFASGKASMGDEFKAFEAQFFAQINRSTLIGKKAPEIALTDTSGNVFMLPETGTKKYKILFFYDTDCPKCLTESILLRNILENDGFSAELLAVYAGEDESSWKNFVRKNLDIRSENLDVIHLWDSTGKADLAMTYGIVQTPRMFLLSPGGVVLGRGLDSYSVEKLLTLVFDESIEYGSDEGIALCKELMSVSEDSDSLNLPVEIAEHLCYRMENDILRRPALKTLLADMMYCISSSRDEKLQNGAEEFLDRFILSRDDIWTTEKDSVQIIGFASFLKEMLGRTPIGSRLPQIKVNTAIKTVKKGKICEKKRIVNLGKLRGRPTRIMFHVEGCHLCEASIEAADSLLISSAGSYEGNSDTNVGIAGRETIRRIRRIVLIDMDEVFASDPATADLLMDTFDLSALPFIIETDRKGIVTRKYIQ